MYFRWILLQTSPGNELVKTKALTFQIQALHGLKFSEGVNNKYTKESVRSKALITNSQEDFFPSRLKTFYKHKVKNSANQNRCLPLRTNFKLASEPGVQDVHQFNTRCSNHTNLKRDVYKYTKNNWKNGVYGWSILWVCRVRRSVSKATKRQMESKEK